MKSLHKIMTVLVAGVLAVTAGCFSSGSQSSSLTGTPAEIIERIYKDIPDDEMPMMMDPIAIDEENIEYCLGTADVDYEEGAVSEPMISSIAYSLVVLRMNETADIEATKKTIEESVNPAKWICVEAEKTVVTDRDNVILVIMSSADMADRIVEIFEKL